MSSWQIPGCLLRPSGQSLGCETPRNGLTEKNLVFVSVADFRTQLVSSGSIAVPTFFSPVGDPLFGRVPAPPTSPWFVTIFELSASFTLFSEIFRPVFWM